MRVDSLGPPVIGKPPAPSDPTPAVRLRFILASRRRRGEPWDDEEFERLARTVVRGLEHRERAAWLAVFAAQQGTWRAAYERELATPRALYRT